MATAFVLSALAPAPSADPARDAVLCADLSADTDRRFDACNGLVANASLPLEIRFEAYLRRAAIYFMEKGDYPLAIADTGEAIKLKPADARGYAARGNYRNAYNEYDKAVADLSEAIRLEPGLVNAYAQRAYAYVQTGESDKAIADYSQVLTLQPGDANTHYDRGGAYEKKGDYDNARADFEQAIRLQRDFAGEFPDTCYGTNANGERGLKNWPACDEN
ncbi:MAG: tetratricopeptide repeat protein [Micropepsaceae bacterium]